MPKRSSSHGGNGSRRERSAPDGEKSRTLIIIGGHEDKQGEKVILRELVRRLGPKGKLVVTTVASHVAGVIIDQHFAERGRMGRLLGAVAQNPRVLGLGIDEGTAIVIEDGAGFTVLGEGAVYAVDGSGVTHSNVAEQTDEEHALSLYDVKVHVLSQGDRFDLRTRRPGSCRVWLPPTCNSRKRCFPWNTMSRRDNPGMDATIH